MHLIGEGESNKAVRGAWEDKLGARKQTQHNVTWLGQFYLSAILYLHSLVRRSWSSTKEEANMPMFTFFFNVQL